MKRAGRMALESVAMLSIGDGLLAMLQPRRHVALWRTGPGPWRRLLQPFEDRPLLAASLGAVEVAAGLLLAARQKPAH